MKAAMRALTIAGLLMLGATGLALADGPRGANFQGHRSGPYLPPNGNPGPFPPRHQPSGGYRPGGYWPVPSRPGRYPGNWNYGRPYPPYWPAAYGGWYGGGWIGYPRW
jgi:hypothetical protein